MIIPTFWTFSMTQYVYYSLKYHAETIVFEYGKHSVMWIMLLPSDTSLYRGTVTVL